MTPIPAQASPTPTTSTIEALPAEAPAARHRRTLTEAQPTEPTAPEPAPTDQPAPPRPRRYRRPARRQRLLARSATGRRALPAGLAAQRRRHRARLHRHPVRAGLAPHCSSCCLAAPRWAWRLGAGYQVLRRRPGRPQPSRVHRRCCCSPLVVVVVNLFGGLLSVLTAGALNVDSPDRLPGRRC